MRAYPGPKSVALQGDSAANLALTPRSVRRHGVTTGGTVGERTQSALDLYMLQIGQVDLLDAEQEVDLAKCIEAGLFAEKKLSVGCDIDPDLSRDLSRIAEEGQAANARIIEANLRLVVHLAKRYPRAGMDLVDLVQEGNLGLIHAVEKFDYTKGYRFSTYATNWIRLSLQRGGRQKRLIQFPHHVDEALTAIRRTEQSLQQELGRTASRQELAERVGRSRRELDALFSLPTVVASLDVLWPFNGTLREPSNDEGEHGETFAPLHELIIERNIDPVPSEVVSGRPDVRAAMSVLTPRQTEVTRLRYGFDDDRPLSRHDVGRRLGVTGERIRQIDKTVLDRLRPRLSHLQRHPSSPWSRQHPPHPEASGVAETGERS